jgi:pimeloyl-ACP methyl ester carboxylesterase
MSALKSITVDGRRLAYREAGRGPAIVFLHGLGGNSASWQPQFDAFADRYHLVAWDMPGFGESDPLAASEASTRDFSLMARKFIASLGIERATGVGTSYGTVILADLAATNPRLISSIVFACGVTGMAEREPQERARLRAVRRGEIESMGQRKFAEMRNSTYVANPTLVARVVELAASAQPQGYMQAYGALTESNIFNSLSKLDLPALVIAGANDPIAKAGDCERVAQALRADYRCIENCGHYVNLEQTETFNRLLGDFLARG